MAAMTARFERSHKQHGAMTAAYAVLFWIVAAALVFAANVNVEPRSPRTGAVVVIAALLSTAFAYTRLVAPNAGSSHALGVGAAWLMLSIVAEVALTTRLGHGWYFLLGSPDRPLLRNSLLFVWIFAPVLFARREENA